jgi:ferredoxin--NADP+ reductase
VARVLAKHEPDLRTTEAPDNVLAGLAESAVTAVHVFGRRGPQDRQFTPIELRELGELRDVDIILHDEDFAHLDDWVAPNNQYKVMLRTLQQWRTRPVGEASRRLHLHFYHAPVAVLGTAETGVEAVRFERTIPDADGRVTGTGEFREVEVGQVYRAVGYYGTPVVDAPFDGARGVVPNVEGRVISADGEHIPGLYATGWIKRGPVGLIGHTKSDASETIRHLVEDVTGVGDNGDVATGDRDGGRTATHGDPQAVLDFLTERGVDFVEWHEFELLDTYEQELGEPHGRERIKVVPREEMIAVAKKRQHS